MIKKTNGINVYLKKQYVNGHKLSDLLFPHNETLYTPREIAQQPYTWRKTASLMQEHAPGLLCFLQQAGLYSQDGNAKTVPNLILTGAGTSDYVGLSLVDLLRIRFATHCNNWATTRITTNPDAYLTKNKKHVMLHFARSGNSPESLAVLKMGLEQFPQVTHHIVITCNKDGELAKLAGSHEDKVYTIILDESVNDRGLAMTSSFSNMIIAGQALVHLDQMQEFINLVDRMALAGEYLIGTYSNRIYELADPGLKRAIYLGNNELFGVAAESALKVQELTVGQIIAKNEDTLAFRHGPISAVDSTTLICFFLSSDPYSLLYELDVLAQYHRQFQKIGAQTVAVCASMSDQFKSSNSDYINYIEFDPHGQFKIPNLYQVNVQVLFGQLFGLFSSIRRNIDVDDPVQGDNPLYSRTVQGVKLYDRAAIEE